MHQLVDFIVHCNPYDTSCHLQCLARAVKFYSYAAICCDFRLQALAEHPNGCRPGVHAGYVNPSARLSPSPIAIQAHQPLGCFMCAPSAVPLRRRFLHLLHRDAACMRQQQQHPAESASVRRQSNGVIHTRPVPPPPFDQRPPVAARAHQSTCDAESMCSFSRSRLAS